MYPRACPSLSIAIMLLCVLQVLLLSAFCCCNITSRSDIRADNSLRSAIAQGQVEEVYFPDDARYQIVSKAFNLRLQYTPAAIAYPHSAGEVANLVKACTLLSVPGGMSIILTISAELLTTTS